MRITLPSKTESNQNGEIVWARFERKFEMWDFGNNNTKHVVYDGIEKGLLYRFIDDKDKRKNVGTTSYYVMGNYEPVFFKTDNIDVYSKEPQSSNKKMFLIAEGYYDGENLEYKMPVLVVKEPVFEKLKQERELAHEKSMNAFPRKLHQDIRERKR